MQQDKKVLIVASGLFFFLFVLFFLLIFAGDKDKQEIKDSAISVNTFQELHYYYLYQEEKILKDDAEDYMILPDKVDVSCGNSCLNESLQKTKLFNRIDNIILYEINKLNQLK